MRPLLAVLLLVGLVGCGGGDNSTPSAGQGLTEAEKIQAWKDELADGGFIPPSWSRWESFTRDTLCANDTGYTYYVTMSTEGGPSLNQQRIGLKYACPERLEEWDAAVLKLGDVNDRVNFLCDTPLDELSDEPKGEDDISDQENALIVCDQYQTPEWERFYDEKFAP